MCVGGGEDFCVRELFPIKLFYGGRVGGGAFFEGKLLKGKTFFEVEFF